MDHRSLAVCAIFRNQAPYLLEWIAYHRVIGFDRFVLYDNGSIDGGADLVRRSTLADRVTVIHWPQRPGQLTAYRHFIDIFAPAYDWAAFLDPDEFVLPLDGNTLHGVLERCGHASAVLVNWRVFGPAGHEEPPPGLVTETYDLRAEDALPVNRHVTTIARCADLLDVTQNPHEFRLKGLVCNPLGQEVPNTALQPSACHHGLVINAYYTKSRQEWLGKLHRAEAGLDTGGSRYTEDVFNHLAAACHVKDETIKAWLPQLRALLGDGDLGLAHAPEVPAAPASTVAGAAPAAFRASPADGPVVAASPERGVPEPAPDFPDPIAMPASVGGIFEPSSQWAAPPPSGAPASPPLAAPVESMPAASSVPPGWYPQGPDAQRHPAGLALVFRDRSRPAAPWLAALRGRAAGLTDPEFLLDETGRLRDFATDSEARSACEALLDEYRLG